MECVKSVLVLLHQQLPGDCGHLSFHSNSAHDSDPESENQQGRLSLIVSAKNDAF